MVIFFKATHTYTTLECNSKTRLVIIRSKTEEIVLQSSSYLHKNNRSKNSEGGIDVV